MIYISIKLIPILSIFYAKVHFVIKKLNDSFLNELKKEGRNNWAKYLSERKKRMDKIEGKLIWQ